MRNTFKRRTFVFDVDTMPSSITHWEAFFSQAVIEINDQINVEGQQSLKDIFAADVPRNNIRSFSVNGKKWQTDYFKHLAKSILTTDDFIRFVKETLGISIRNNQHINNSPLVKSFLKSGFNEKEKKLCEWFSSNDALNKFISVVTQKESVSVTDVFLSLSFDYFCRYANANESAYMALVNNLYIQGMMVAYPLRAAFLSCVMPLTLFYDSEKQLKYMFTNNCKTIDIEISSNDEIKITGTMPYYYKAGKKDPIINLNGSGIFSVVLTRQVRPETADIWAVKQYHYHFEGSDTFKSLMQSEYPGENFSLQRKLLKEADVLRTQPEALKKFDRYVRELLTLTDDYSGLNLEENDCSKIDFRKKKSNGIRLHRAELRQAKFSHEQVLQLIATGHKKFEGIDVTDEDFSEGDIAQTVMQVRQAKADPALFELYCDEVLRVKNVMQQRAQTVQGNDLSNLDLSFAHFLRTSLRNVSFRKTNLRGALLDKSVLYHTDFTEANLCCASLCHMRFEDVTLKNTRINALTKLTNTGIVQSVSSNSQSVIFVIEGESPINIPADPYLTLTTLKMLQERNLSVEEINHEILARLTSAFKLQADSATCVQSECVRALKGIKDSTIAGKTYKYQYGSQQAVLCFLHESNNKKIMTVASQFEFNAKTESELTLSVFQRIIHRMVLSKMHAQPDDQPIDCIQYCLLNMKHKNQMIVQIFKKNEYCLGVRIIGSQNLVGRLHKCQEEAVNTVRAALSYEMHLLSRIFKINPLTANLEVESLEVSDRLFDSSKPSSVIMAMANIIRGCLEKGSDFKDNEAILATLKETPKSTATERVGLFKIPSMQGKASVDHPVSFTK